MYHTEQEAIDAAVALVRTGVRHVSVRRLGDAYSLNPPDVPLRRVTHWVAEVFSITRDGRTVVRVETREGWEEF